MADRRENSVLFSLRELRDIEGERVKGEEDAEKARQEADRRAREDEIRQAREAEEAKIRSEQERVRRDQDAKERAVREDQLRLAESERRAQIEAAARLDQARIEAEAKARIDAKGVPVGPIVGGVIALIVVAGSIMGFVIHKHGVEMREQQAVMQAKAEADRRTLMAQQGEDQRKLKEEMAALQAQLDKAGNDAERAKIRAQMIAAQQTHRAGAKKAATTADGTKKVNSKSTDPLEGLDL